MRITLQGNKFELNNNTLSWYINCHSIEEFNTQLAYYISWLSKHFVFIGYSNSGASSYTVGPQNQTIIFTTEFTDTYGLSSDSFIKQFKTFSKTIGFSWDEDGGTNTPASYYAHLKCKCYICDKEFATEGNWQYSNEKYEFNMEHCGRKEKKAFSLATVDQINATGSWMTFME